MPGNIFPGINYTQAAADRGAFGQGQSVARAVRVAGISEQSYYRWRKQHGRLRLEQAKHLKFMDKENQRLKKLVA